MWYMDSALSQLPGSLGLSSLQPIEALYPSLDFLVKVFSSPALFFLSCLFVLALRGFG